MIGLDQYVGTKRSFLGFDYSKLMSAAGGALSAAGGSGGGGDAAAAAKIAEMQKQQAEASANTWKLVGVVGIVVIIAGVFMLRPKQAAA